MNRNAILCRLRISVFVTLAMMNATAFAQETISLDQELSHGYAMLHDALKRLKHLDKVLLLKKESPSVGQAIRNLAEVAGQLDADLRRIAGRDATIQLDDQGLTRFEIEKREALMFDRGLSLGMPLLGETGASMERTALLSLSAAINQQRYLIQVMIPDEYSQKRITWLKEARKKLDGVYVQMVQLLKNDYFCDSMD